MLIKLGIKTIETRDINDGIHSSVGKSLHWHVITTILYNAKVGVFPQGYVLISSLVSLVEYLPLGSVVLG